MAFIRLVRQLSIRPQGSRDEGNKTLHNRQKELSAKMESSLSAECWCGKEMQMLLLARQVNHKCILAADRLKKDSSVDSDLSLSEASLVGVML